MSTWNPVDLNGTARDIFARFECGSPSKHHKHGHDDRCFRLAGALEDLLGQAGFRVVRTEEDG